MAPLSLIFVICLLLQCYKANVTIPPILSDERLVFQTTHGDIELAFFPEVHGRGGGGVQGIGRAGGGGRLPS